MEIPTKPKVRFKSFTYQTYLDWIGNRAGMLHSKSKPEFRVASPPEFKGEAGVWTPEDLFVAAVEICTMTTFLAFAQRKNLPLLSYNSHAEGALKFVNGKYQFTEIILRPVIALENEEAFEDARQILAQVHENCLVANSIKSSVVVEPNFIVSTGGRRNDAGTDFG